MKMAKFWHVSFVVFVAAVANVATFGADDLFALKDSPQAKSVDQRSSIASVREAEIVIGRSVLSRNREIRLQLFDNKVFTASRLATEGLEIRGSERLTWRGKITDKKFMGDVLFTQNGSVFSGIIYSPDAVYEIVAIGDKHFLVQLDQALFPECGGGVKGEEVQGKSQIGSGPATDSGDRIDVLVLYTTPVKNSLGGDAQAQAFAQQAIDVTNTAYINSRIRQRVRMVAAQETAIAEVGALGTELSTLRNDPTVANLRNQFNADLVAMLSNSSDACGIGYLMGSNQASGNANNAFTVTSRTCAVGNLSFPHELGHNMGSQHNPENGSGPTYPYGFGHYVNGSYRTVMSYVDPCTSGCSRVAYFSNPNVIFNGVPTGIDNARDNARSINNTADPIANYRYSGSNIMITSFSSGGSAPRGITRNLTWTSDNITGDVRIEYSRDEGITWTTLVTTTPNDGSENIVMPQRVTRRGRIRVSSLTTTYVSDSSVTNFAIR